MNFRRTETRLLALLLLLWLRPALPALAQELAEEVPAASPATFGAQAITIEVETFGVGDYSRPGSWAGIRLVLTDQTDRPRAVAVRLHMEDYDGDIELLQRTVTLNPQRREGVWLYARMPWSLSRTSTFSVTVHEISSEADDRMQVGRQLAARRIQPGGAARILRSTDGLIGVVGRRSLGLERYADRIDVASRESDAIAAHEPIEWAPLTPRGIPDHWVGLEQFEAIIWEEGDVDDLGEDVRPNAIAEWVHRGGHLIIVMDPTVDTWFRSNNTFQRLGLLPRADVVRVEDVSLEPYRGLLSTPDHADRPLPVRTVLYSFERLPDAEPDDAVEIIRGMHGCVVMRRLVGTGMVTVIGLDLRGNLLTTSETLRADAFWNRVLGKRSDALSGKERQALRQNIGMLRQRSSVFADGYIGAEITHKARAGLGVLLGLIVFIAYWIIAGPGGYGVLRGYHKVQHAWLLFVGTTLAFTLVAWTAATIIKPKSVDAHHLTYLDHVYGQPVQAARTWASIFLPEYGEQTVAIESEDVDARWRHVIAPWSSPALQDRSLSFPDARGYVVDVRRLDRLTVPTRATIKEFQFDWLGAPRWTTPVPLGPEYTPFVNRQGRLEGALRHGLSGPLKDVTVMFVQGQLSQAEQQQALARDIRGLLLANAYAWRLPEPWRPDDPLDLGSLDPKVDPEPALLERLVPTTSGSRLSMPDLGEPRSLDGNEVEFHEMLAWYSVLEPPEYDTEFTNQRRRKVVHRRMGIGRDLGKWFTQPCLIIVGHLEEAQTPTPIVVDGREIRSSGRTVVRWVYPLPQRPPLMVGEALDADDRNDQSL